MLYAWLRMIYLAVVASALILLVYVAFDSISWALVLLLVYIILHVLWRYHWIIKDDQQQIDGYKRESLTSKTHISKLNAEIDSLNNKLSYWASKADEYQSLANDLQAKLNECESKLLHIERISVGDSNESLSDRNMALSIQVEEKDSVIQQMSNELKICKTICRIPKSVSFYRDGMPVFHSPDPARPYGEWTVYINRRSCIYHLDYYCSPYSSERSHLFSVLGTDIRPCKKCASGKIRFPGVPLWYKNYLDVEPQAKELGFLGRTLSANLDHFDSMQREDRSDFSF